MNKQVPECSPWLTLAEAADYLKLNYYTMRALVQDRKLTACRTAARGHIRVLRSELDDYLRRNEIPQEPV